MKKSFSYFIFVLLAFMPIQFNTALANTVEIENLKKTFIEFYGNDENYNIIVKAFQVSPEKEDVILEHLKKVFSDDIFISKMIEEMENQGILNAIIQSNDSDEVIKLSMGFGYQFVTELSLKGIKRMSDERIKEYLNMTGYFFAVLEPHYCRILMGESVSQEDEINASISGLRKLNAAEMRYYFELTREAIFFELNDWPIATSLNDYQVTTGQRLFEKSLGEVIENHPQQQAIETALIEPHKARDNDFCITGQEIMSIIYNLEGMAGNWFRRSFVQSM